MRKPIAVPASAYSAPRTFFHRLWYEPPPAVGVEFSSGAVAVANWLPGKGAIERFTTEPLEDGALRPSPVRENFLRPDEVRRALATALGRVTRRNGGSIAVFLPDTAARVSVLSFEQLPEKAEEALPQVRWRLKKSVPFEIEQAAVAIARSGSHGEIGGSALAALGATEVVVAAAPRTVVAQYESALESLGYSPGFVTLSSLAALGLLPGETRQTGTMFVRSAGRLLTIVITSLGCMRMFRSTELPDGEQHSVEEVIADAYASAVYFQDHYGAPVDRLYMAGFGARSAELQERAVQELGVHSQPLVVPGTRGADEQFLGLYGMVAEQAKGD